MAGEYAVKSLCGALGVSRSGYYAHKNKPQGLRRQQDKELTAVMYEAFVQNDSSYGSPRLVKAVREKGLACGKTRMRRLMCQAAIQAPHKRPFRPQTTDSNHGLAIAPNWLAELARPDAPDRIWVCDITYIWTCEGWLYLAGVMDLFSRMIIGWAVGKTMQTELVERALDKALTRQPGPGLIHHSDQGSQYASGSYRDKLRSAGITASMSRRGNCYDNACKESFWSTLKTECLRGLVPATRKEAELRIFSYIEGFYNTRRYHSSLGYSSPAHYEMDYHQSQATRRARAVSGAALDGEAAQVLLSA